MKCYPYELVGGHIIVVDGADRLLLDTGGPTSVAETGALGFGGIQTSTATDYMGVTPASLSEHIGCHISALVGADVLNQFDVRIDPTNRTVTIQDDEPELNGTVMQLDFFMGIPVVEVGVGTRSVRMFFDTGAKLSYVSPDITTGVEPAGQEDDFYPGVGKFTTEAFDVRVHFGEESCALRVGHLPELLQMTLMMADTSGILGTAILNNYAVHYAPRRHSLGLMKVTAARQWRDTHESPRARAQERRSRNAFVALSELASRENWCWRIWCTTCGCMYFRYAFAELVAGKHPDSPDWFVYAKNHHQLTTHLGPLPFMDGPWDLQRQQALLEIVGNASMQDIHRSARFPDWLGYIGLVLHFCGSAESRSRTLTTSLCPQFLGMVDQGSVASDYLSRLRDSPQDVLAWRKLELIEQSMVRQGKL